MSTVMHKSNNDIKNHKHKSARYIDTKTKQNNNDISKNTENKCPTNISKIDNSSRIIKSSISAEEYREKELELFRENRISQVISLYSKGFTQFEIAEKLGVNQSTISRDLQCLQEESKKQIWKYLNEDILFEYLRYIVGNNEISKKLWEIVQNENTSTKEKTNALSLLNQSYIKRLEILMNGPESFKDVKKSFSEIDDIEMMERNPMLKLSSKLGQLRSPFSKR